MAAMVRRGNRTPASDNFLAPEVLQFASLLVFINFSWIGIAPSLVPRPFQSPVYDRLCILQAITNWWWGMAWNRLSCSISSSCKSSVMCTELKKTFLTRAVRRLLCSTEDNFNSNLQNEKLLRILNASLGDFMVWGSLCAAPLTFQRETWVKSILQAA